MPCWSEDKEWKLADLPGVREHCEEYPVEIWRNWKGRVVVRAWNEGHNNTTDVDLLDLLAALKTIDADLIKAEMERRRGR